jgi:hypothetical protein
MDIAETWWCSPLAFVVELVAMCSIASIRSRHSRPTSATWSLFGIGLSAGAALETNSLHLVVEVGFMALMAIAAGLDAMAAFVIKRTNPDMFSKVYGSLR